MPDNRIATIRMTKDGIRPQIEVAVPVGTSLADTFKLHDVLSKDVISKLSPRGCLACNSGVDIWIHESFEDVFRVNLDKMQIER